MPEQFQTSFIPKKVVDEQESSFSGSGITTTIGIILLVISLALGGGVFAYEKYLDGALVRKKDELQRQKEAFAPELIREMSRMSQKLKVADSLLNKHISSSEIFELIQDITLQTVRFKNFSFSRTQQGVGVDLQGEGVSFTSVALQADEFGKNRFLSNALFSGFTLDQVGNVQFTVSTMIDPSVISYASKIRDGGVATVEIEKPQDVMTDDVMQGEAMEGGTQESVSTQPTQSEQPTQTVETTNPSSGTEIPASTPDEGLLEDAIDQGGFGEGL